MAITSKDLAALCGVSQGTVDRALHNRPGIRPATRERILLTARQLGYRPDQLASSLVRGRTMTIGLVLFDLYNRFFAQIANAVEESARRRGYFVYLTLTRKDLGEEKSCIEHLAGRRVDGLILCSVGEGSEYLAYLQNLGIPVVAVANRLSEAFPFAGIDDRAAMYDAVRYALSRGYRRIVYVSPPLARLGKTNLYAQERRMRGCLDALEQCGRGVESWIVDTADYIKKLDVIKLGEGPRTAFLCSSDLYALEVMNSLHARGVRIPAEAGLMGFDHIDVLKYIRPALSTVAYPMEKLGSRSVDLLLQLIHGRTDWSDAALAHRIVEGETM